MVAAVMAVRLQIIFSSHTGNIHICNLSLFAKKDKGGHEWFLVVVRLLS